MTIEVKIEVTIEVKNVSNDPNSSIQSKIWDITTIPVEPGFL